MQSGGGSRLTERYVLLGGDVSKSPTPTMMNAAFEALGVDAVYQASNVGAAELNAALAKLRERGTSGANVTIPHKTSIARLLSSLDDVSSRVGAVNTLKREGGSYRGYNTDVDGILGPLAARGIRRVNRASVLGTGGAARAFCEAMHALKCRELSVISRNPARAAGFIASMRTAFPETRIDFDSTGGQSSSKTELFFNASPAGANGIPLPMGITQFLEGLPVVFDAVYSPVETDLIKGAGGFGCPVIYGHEMLLHQGLKSLQVWLDADPPFDIMKTALLEFLGATSD